MTSLRKAFRICLVYWRQTINIENDGMMKINGILPGGEVICLIPVMRWHTRAPAISRHNQLTNWTATSWKVTDRLFRFLVGIRGVVVMYLQTSTLQRSISRVKALVANVPVSMNRWASSRTPLNLISVTFIAGHTSVTSTVLTSFTSPAMDARNLSVLLATVSAAFPALEAPRNTPIPAAKAPAPAAIAPIGKTISTTDQRQSHK